MTILLTADIHLDENRLHEHRWGLLPWLAEQAQQHHAGTIVVLGDFTSRKDHHSSVLVNRLVDVMKEIQSRSDLRVILLQGNHDYIDPSHPFFRFLEADRIAFVAKPQKIELQFRRRRSCMFIPSGHAADEITGMGVFTHQLFHGARADDMRTVMHGGKLPSDMQMAVKVWSGDVHAPQKLGTNIEYVGAPYRIHFGDWYIPRVVLLHDLDEYEELYYPCPSKELVELQGLSGLSGVNVRPGDLVKVRYAIVERDYPDWPLIKRAIEDWARIRQVELCGVECVAAGEEETMRKPPAGTVLGPEQELQRYAAAKGYREEVVQIGLSLLRG